MLGTLDAIAREYGTREDLERDGVWVQVQLERLPVGHLQPEFRVARMNKSNRRWVAAAEAQTKRYGRKVDLGLIKAEESRKSNLKIFCHSVIRDWRNIFNAAGEAVPYDAELCFKFLSANDDIYTYLLSEATNGSRYQAVSDEVVEAEVGESVTTSVGS